MKIAAKMSGNTLGPAPFRKNRINIFTLWASLRHPFTRHSGAPLYPCYRKLLITTEMDVSDS